MLTKVAKGNKTDLFCSNKFLSKTCPFAFSVQNNEISNDRVMQGQGKAFKDIS